MTDYWQLTTPTFRREALPISTIIATTYDHTQQNSFTRWTVETGPRLLRLQVHKLACYFRREFGYDFVQYSVSTRDEDPRDRAVLWTIPHDDPGHDRSVGAASFRWREWMKKPASYSLQWIWLHPYVRGQGLLTTAWPAFRATFGAFPVESPWSAAMDGFLVARGDAVPRQGRKT